MLCCPHCHKDLLQRSRSLFCPRCDIRMKVDGNIIVNASRLPADLQISSEKWNLLYTREFRKKQYQEKYQQYMELYFNDVYEQLSEVKPIRKIVYLEIGCGNFLLGQAIAKRCHLIIGVDMSHSALRIAERMLKEKGITNYLLVQGDINHMPIRGDSIDLIYGGGVIEHFKDTRTCLQELYRVLKKGGVSFNTVPFLNIGSLTYRQIWGNIPNVPVLKQVAEFIHLKLLGAKHMIYGYEMSFTKGTLRTLHEKVGFRRVTVDKFRISSIFDFAPIATRPFLSYLADKSPLFWPMVKVIGIK